jgi:predicted choloylglycine hydrolase
MQDRSTIHHVSYTHSVLEGTAYQVGQQQAEWLAQYLQAVTQFLTPPLAKGGPLTPQQTDEALAFFARYCPGLNEEIQGFADGLGLPLAQILYYATAYAHPGRCSHMVVLPSASKDGHLYVGRSYEWSHEDEDLNLSTARVAGRAAHVGFSTNLFGRVDGLNEHGLCVTMSSGAIPNVPPVKALAEPGGCRFWAAIRTVLDRCRTVDEALEVVQELPLSSTVILILADRSGQAALVEIFDSHRAVKRVGPGAPEGVLFATNHYTLPAMLTYDITRMRQSVARYRAIQSRLQAAAPHITPETIRGILTDPVPQGIYCPCYSDYLGTLWSQIFDVTAGTVEVCFGAPAYNRWHTFNLGDPVGLTHYAVELHDEVADPAIWQVLPPGKSDLSSE